MHPWVKGILVCTNEGPSPISSGDNYQIAKMHWRNLKLFFFRTAGPISFKLSTKHPWEKGIQVCSKEVPFNSHKLISTWFTPRTKDFCRYKWLGRYQVQASRFMAQVIVLVIINTMISNDWKIGIMEESKKSQYKYCLIVKNRENLKF